MRKLKKGLLWIGLGSVFFIMGCFVLVQITPVPVAYLTRMAFDGGEDGVAYGLHPDYASMEERVMVVKDQRYPSAYERNTYDLYLPKEEGAYPIVLWIHGGAFVGGDKKDITTFATALASEGVAVISMNYALAPEETYPVPLLQTQDLAKEMQNLAQRYPLDLAKIFIGGDSAGAHIAMQFTLSQVDETYRSHVSMDAIFPAKDIQGMISFCGLLDLSMYDETDSGFSNFLYRQSARTYFDSSSWKEELASKYADVGSYINAKFPPVYLTDGDRNSFLAQAKQMEQMLQNKHVEVTSFLLESGNHPHEYQFHLDQEAAIENFQKVVAFIKEHSKE